MKSSTKSVFIVLAALSGGALLYTHFHKQQPASAIGANESSSSAARSSASSSNPADESSAGPPTVPLIGVAAAHIDYAAQFRGSTNYFLFIRRALPAAQAGDRDAAYFLAAALTYCDDTHRFFFERRGKVLSVDEAITERARLPGPSMTEAIQRAVGRCHEVYEARNPTWGTADTWMTRAADAGQPVAQIRTATAALLAINNPEAPEIRRVGRSNEILNVDDARELIRIAIASKDPEALFQASDLLLMLNPDMPLEEVMKEGLVWKYAACLRGADCGKDAEWMFAACTYDPICAAYENGLDYLRYVAASMEVFDVEWRANAVLTRINEKAWSELGLSGATG